MTSRVLQIGLYLLVLLSSTDAAPRAQYKIVTGSSEARIFKFGRDVAKWIADLRHRPLKSYRRRLGGERAAIAL